MTRPRSILAAVVALVAVAVYAALWVGYRQDWGWLHNLDWALLNGAHDIGVKHPVWVQFWDGVSFWLGPIPIRLLGSVAVLVLLAKRKLRAALLVLACLPLNGFVTMAAKGLADRPRPATALVIAPSTSFPSGHAFEVMAAVLVILTLLLPALSRSMRVVAVTLGVLSVLMCGISRVALNVHHPSDVLAGWALGYVYFLACVWVFRPPPLFGDERASGALSNPATPPGNPDVEVDAGKGG